MIRIAFLAVLAALACSGPAAPAGPPPDSDRRLAVRAVDSLDANGCRVVWDAGEFVTLCDEKIPPGAP